MKTLEEVMDQHEWRPIAEAHRDGRMMFGRRGKRIHHFWWEKSAFKGRGSFFSEEGGMLDDISGPTEWIDAPYYFAESSR